ncbi:MAG: hypothetical protein M1837_003418 [Sclerophora amabilis]|nr:MAG: hypothetical protein M1837_003418 [Sclerophora amabilis]
MTKDAAGADTRISTFPAASSGARQVLGNIRFLYTSSSLSRNSSGTQAKNHVKSIDLAALFPALDPKSADVDVKTIKSKSNTRNRLQSWREEHDDKEDFLDLIRSSTPAQTANFLTASGLDSQKPNEEDEDDALLATIDDSNSQDMEGDFSREFLNPGDLVELSGGSNELAVFVRVLDQQSQFYTERGEWVHGKFNKARFVLPKFFAPELYTPLLPHLPPNEIPAEVRSKLNVLDPGVPREVGAPIIKELMKFRSMSDEIYRKYSTKLDGAHSLLADEHEPKSVTLGKVTNLLLGDSVQDAESSNVALYTVHRALSSIGSGFKMDSGHHRRTNKFLVLSKGQLCDIDIVREWTRAYKEGLLRSVTDNRSPLQRFIFKAIKLIRRSRRMRSMNERGMIGPYAGDKPFVPDETGATFQPMSPGIPFTADDKIIIRALEGCCARRYFRDNDQIQSICSLILRATGAYKDYQLSNDTVFMFLQEIGVYSPWEKMTSFAHAMQLPGYVESSPMATAMDEYAKFDDEKVSAFTDSMSELRRDWKELDVLCIDSEHTHDVDDGISLEKIPGSESEFWIHIHVANPSAFIPPDHALAGQAESLYRTMYLPEQTFPMLPRLLSQSRLSLAPNRPAITISAKIDQAGQIAETRLMPTTVRKVFFVTPNQIDQVFGEHAGADQAVITVGGEMPRTHQRERKKQHKLSSSHIENLRTLRIVTDKLRFNRAQKGGLNRSIPKGALSVYKGPESQPSDSPSYDESRFFRGDPVIQLKVSHFDPDDNQPQRNIADGIVSEIMILAGEVAARWCDERNIPICYRGSLINQEKKHLIKSQREMVSSVVDERGFIPLPVMLNAASSHSTTVMTTTPFPHLRMGIDKYVQATSPLRRYGDLLTHWQIDAALAHEARTGESLIGSQREDYLPFSRARMREIMPKLLDRETALRLHSAGSEYFWICQFFHRAHSAKQADLPRTFEFYVLRTLPSYRLSVVLGYITMFSVKALMSIPDWLKESEIKMGDRFEVEIHEVTTYPLRILLSPIRIISKAE